MLAELMPLVSVECRPRIREQNRRPYHREATHKDQHRHNSAAVLVLTRCGSKGESHYRQSEADYKSPRLDIHISMILGDLIGLHKMGAHHEVPDAGR
jgi:hypothetical protein